MREEYKHPHCDVMGSSDRADKCAKIQNTQLAHNGDLGISVIHRLVRKYETLPVLPKKLTETQEKSALFSRRGSY
jgi:hypothetical protein